MKGTFYILPVVMLLLIFPSCSPKDDVPANLVSLQGKTMGTSLAVKYIDSAQRDLSQPIDSILQEVNNSMSTYIPNSTISIFNNLDSTGRMEVDAHFFQVFKTSKQVHNASNGAFNPAIMPLVKYWGFADEDPPDQVDSSKVDSLLAITDFDLIDGVMAIGDKGDTSYYIKKQDSRLQLDFSAIAKGYGVDAVGRLLEDKGIGDYMVEIGGEVRCRGNYQEGIGWKIGIEDPKRSTTEQRESSQIVTVNDKSLATSGNYRNVREIDGQKYAHTLNPVTGYPEHNRLLSISIIADDCMTADGFATACMVMGTTNTKELLARNDGLEGFLIIGGEGEQLDLFYTPGFKKRIVEE